MNGPTGQLGFEHSPYTFEGTIERLGALSRGVNAATRRGDRRLRTFALVFLGLLVVVGIAAWLASVL